VSIETLSAGLNTPPHGRSAGEVFANLRLTPAAQALLDPAMRPRAFVEALVTAKLYVPAIEAVAHVLPPRLGLWWAMLCAQHATAAETLEDGQLRLFRLALWWVQEPQAAVEAAAREAGARTLGGLLCLSAAMHDRPDGRVAIANVVKLASARAVPTAMLDTQRAYAVLGLEVSLSECEFATHRPPPRSGQPERSS
jgi:hypothetical protein